MPNAGPYLAELSYVIDEPWLLETPLTLGPIPPGQGTPHCFVCVSTGERRLLRLDIYANPSCYCFRDEAVVQGHTVFVGVDHHVFAISLLSRAVIEHELDSYFGSFHPLEDGILVCSGSSLYRFSDDATLRWRAPNIGIDGVLVHDVRDGVVFVDAELDPPGGWRSLAINLATGAVLNPAG